MSLPAKILLLLLLNYIDGLATLHFVIKYGEKVEQNPAILFLFTVFGVETVIFIKIIGMTIMGTVGILSCKEDTETSYAHFLVNLILIIYLFVCGLHFINLILH